MIDKDNLNELKISSSPFLRLMLIASGVIFVAVGILGMFLPILPTTIFFILAAWCFARSSKKFYHWLHHNKLFGKYLRNYREGSGMTMTSKIISMTILWLSIGYSIMYATQSFYIRILLAAIAIGVTWHLLTIKTAKKPM